jgi:outer membrane protein
MNREQLSRAGLVGGVLTLGLLLGGAAGDGAPQEPTRLAFVNARAVLEAVPEYQAAESAFARELESFRDEVSRLQLQLDSAVREYDQQSVVLSPSAKQAKERELQQLDQRLQQRSGELQQRAEVRQQELLEPIQQRVNAIIEGLRAEGNYAFIFDAGSPGIIAADRSLDLTRAVLQRLGAAP